MQDHPSATRCTTLLPKLSHTQTWFVTSQKNALGRPTIRSSQTVPSPPPLRDLDRLSPDRPNGHDPTGMRPFEAVCFPGTIRDLDG